MLIKLFVVMTVLHCLNANPSDLCLPLGRLNDHQAEPMEIAQGRPGKIGPVGPHGEKGDRGEKGECSCDESVKVQVLEEQIRELNETLQRLVRGRGLQENSENGDMEVINNMPGQCEAGLKDGRIEDGQISASSHHGNWPPHHARLDREVTSLGGGTWLPKNPQMGAWIQVDFRTPTRVVGVVTQGHPLSTWWVTRYKISYGNSLNRLSVIQEPSGGDKVFEADPEDGSAHVTNRFPSPVTGRYFRLIVVNYVNASPTLRMEYLLC